MISKLSTRAVFRVLMRRYLGLVCPQFLGQYQAFLVILSALGKSSMLESFPNVDRNAVYAPPMTHRKIEMSRYLQDLVETPPRLVTTDPYSH